MKIFSVQQVQKWDAFTIDKEGISSIKLMERAAVSCFGWIVQNFDEFYCFKIFCGKGNNGGDGLALARLLNSIKYQVSVFIPDNDKPGSPDFEKNLEKLKKTSVHISVLQNQNSFPQFSEKDIIIDALFGTGLNKPVTGFYKEIIRYINANTYQTIAIDVPSGLYIDKSTVAENKNASVIKADYTLTFQNQKLAFLVEENEPYTGKVVFFDIGLSKDYETSTPTPFEYVDDEIIKGIYQPRKNFANKGNYGYASLLCGSYGMMGAAVLSSLACLRSGVGKLTSVVCEAGYGIMQTAVPEAMCIVSGEKHISDFDDFQHFDVVGIGPGIGKLTSHVKLLENLFKSFKKPIVVDADALNILSENQELYSSVPADTVITPHPKEFERLFGKSKSDFDRINKAIEKAKEFKIYIVLKGHHTLIATPDGKGYFNSTGNPGMATAGAGDALTGIITGLLAQKYSPLQSCLLGVYLHGLAGDMASEKLSQEALIAKDIVDTLGAAFKKIQQG
ncbi:MAG TPA: NAD(P)H-hydrate dehydratase [Hanamia sp.]|nr:NAD(P)H-hydrate dehydratase [Hanamia sp.]